LEHQHSDRDDGTACARQKRKPWLGRKGLAATVLLYLAGCAMVFSFIHAEYKFLASPMQLAGAAAAAALLAALAFAAGAEAGAADGSASSGASQPVGESPETSGRAPGSGSGVRPWLIGIGAFAVSSAFIARPEHGWGGLAAGCFLIAAAWILVRRLSRSPWWSVRHRLALVSGTLLTYAWLGFYVTYLLWPDDRIAWFGNGLFALTAVALAALMARRARAHAGGGNH
jgi:hypothetical protein